MKVISPLDGGGQEVILTLIQGGCNFILRPTLLILEPPLQIIIAQSLRNNKTICMGKKRNVLHKQNQEVQNSFKFEFALNGPAKKIHNKNNFSLCQKGKNI